jgi:ATP-dependent DNA helicase UvrD/PcrA
VLRLASNWLNQEQDNAVQAAPQPPTFIVAGPGPGKSTALALRVIKLIFVDNIAPFCIMATTRIRKAGADLKSRIRAWGYTTLG